MKNIMKEAHKMAKEITNKYEGVDYKVQLGLCLSYLASKEEKEMIEYKTSRGAEVKVELEGRTIKNLYLNGMELFKDNKKSINVFVDTLNNVININNDIVRKKLGCKAGSKVWIEASNELIEAFRKADKEEREKREEYLNKAYKKGTVSDCTFKKHMTDINA